MVVNKKKKTTKSGRKNWKRTIILGLLIVLFVDFFLYESVVVTDSKMENTLFPGDIVVINEFSYGKRLPVTLVTLPFFRDNIPFTSVPSFIDLFRLPYYRLPGIGEYQRNDLFAVNYPLEFDLPLDKKSVVIKRCVALPGDTIAVTDKKVFVNGTLVSSMASCKYRYRIVSRNPLSDEYLNEHRIFEGGVVLPPNVYDFYISDEVADSLRNDTAIKNVNIMKIPRNLESTMFFPNNSFYSWNLDYFGDVVVPAKGVTVKLDEKTLPLYSMIIDYYEDNDFYIQDAKAFINGVEADSYTFKYDYFFVMDDNRDNSKDSRMWGFVPETHILGKVAFVFFSMDSGHNSWWSRFFKIPD